jgi:CheY-like chemotaxis protein
VPDSCQIFSLSKVVLNDARSGAVRVLVVDDYQDTADAIGMLLEIEGFDVRVAYHGMSALELAQGWKPQIILLDICMPDMSGLEVASQLRASDCSIGVVLIGHSALTSSSDINEARRTGFDAYCSKPMDITALAPIIHRFVRIMR